MYTLLMCTNIYKYIYTDCIQLNVILNAYSPRQPGTTKYLLSYTQLIKHFLLINNIL